MIVDVKVYRYSNRASHASSPTTVTGTKLHLKLAVILICGLLTPKAIPREDVEAWTIFYLYEAWSLTLGKKTRKKLLQTPKVMTDGWCTIT